MPDSLRLHREVLYIALRLPDVVGQVGLADNQPEGIVYVANRQLLSYLFLERFPSVRLRGLAGKLFKSVPDRRGCES